MFDVTLKINVKNHDELEEKYSGELKSESFSDANINEKIESEIKRQIEEALDNSIKREFLKNKVKAKILIKQSYISEKYSEGELSLIEIKIQVQIENHKEIAKGQGSLFKFVPSFVLNGKVEEEIKKQLKKALNVSLKDELSQSGVEADVSVNQEQFKLTFTNLAKLNMKKTSARKSAEVFLGF